MAGGSRMARAGIEPATPRFSVVRSNLSDSAGSPAKLRILAQCPPHAEVRKFHSSSFRFPPFERHSFLRSGPQTHLREPSPVEIALLDALIRRLSATALTYPQINRRDSLCR